MSGRSQKELSGVTLLGNQRTKYHTDYAPEVLETFPNKHPENDYFVKFNCPEFTSLCPMTGQPDFATIYISYVPGERMVESKSLKLYLFSFRNHGDFHEDCVNIIMKDLIAFRVIAPHLIFKTTARYVIIILRTILHTPQFLHDLLCTLHSLIQIQMNQHNFRKFFFPRHPHPF